MPNALVAVLIKALEANPKIATSVVRELCDLVDANPALLSEIIGYLTKTK